MSSHPPKNPMVNLFGVLALLALAGVIFYAVQSASSLGPQNAEARSAGATALAEAAHRGDLPAVKTEIAAGADVNQMKASGPAGEQGTTPLIAAATAGHVEVVRALIDAKAALNTASNNGRTALIGAAGWGGPECVRALLDAGARIDSKAENGFTALMFAAARGELDSVKALITNGADVDAKNKWRQTALMAAARSGSVEKVTALLAAGAAVDARDMNGATALLIGADSEVGPEILAALIGSGADPNAADGDDVTALMKAAYRADEAQMGVLLAANAKKDAKDKGGRTARDWAISRDDDKGKSAAAMLDGGE